VTLSRPVRVILWIAAGVFVTLAAIVWIVIVRFQPVARQYVISTLQERYKSEVELGNFQISLFPLVHATGDNLVLRWGGRKDLPPMIEIRRFTIEARFVGFFRYPRRIRKLTLEGLQLHLPPKSAQPREAGGNSSAAVSFVLEEVVADGTTLQTLPSDPKKLPLTFDIRQLTLHTVGKGVPMIFHALLDNAKPPGLIQSDGQFGPWDSDEPGGTPVSGRDTFQDAD
jgi:hypothetical protein